MGGGLSRDGGGGVSGEMLERGRIGNWDWGEERKRAVGGTRPNKYRI